MIDHECRPPTPEEIQIFQQRRQEREAEVVALRSIINDQITRLMEKFPDHYHWRPNSYELAARRKISDEILYIAGELAEKAKQLGIIDPIVLLAPGTMLHFSLTDRSHMPGIDQNPIYKKDQKAKIKNTKRIKS